MNTETGSKMRLTLITLGTTLVSLAVVGNAFYQKQQFYPSIVFLTKSSPSVAVKIFLFIQLTIGFDICMSELCTGITNIILIFDSRFYEC